MVLSDTGIHSGPMAREYGIAFVPWNEIENMDIFASSSEDLGITGYFLRIGLKDGALCRKIRKSALQTLAQAVRLGRDVNLPIGDGIDPDDVLAQASELWKFYGIRKEDQGIFTTRRS